MYFYKGNTYSSKPRGIEFKTDMPGVSVVIEMSLGDTFNYGWSDPHVNSTLVIEYRSGKVSYSTGCLSIGENWEDEYRVFYYRDAYSTAEKLERYIGYELKQRIVLKGNMNYTPNGQFITGCGNVGVKFLEICSYRKIAATRNFTIPLYVYINGERNYFNYSYEMQAGSKYIRTLKFVGMTTNYQDIKNLHDILFEMGFNV